MANCYAQSAQIRKIRMRMVVHVSVQDFMKAPGPVQGAELTQVGLHLPHPCSEGFCV